MRAPPRAGAVGLVTAATVARRSRRGSAIAPGHGRQRCEMIRVMQLHPIMYVADQYAEREFYLLFGFEHLYEGDEFPGFLAIRHGDAIIGLQRASAEQPVYSEGLRWQFELDSPGQLDELIEVCRVHTLDHDVIIERGGDRFHRRLLAVRSPAGVTVWFEGTNEADLAATGGPSPTG